MPGRLGHRFFNRPTVKVARGLLGCYLMRKVGSRLVCARITETEAYVGPNDKASHASRGRTPRTEVMFGPPGYLYVYLVYGMYHCLNVVTEEEGYPAAVLIRSVEVISPRQGKVISGPGRLCRALKISKRLNGQDIVTSRGVWFERGVLRKGEKIVTGKRIGVPYAGTWQYKPWRFWIKKEG
ncbi:MAG: DNA-3-methyladenine glycosylase [Candidatus Veblenbacteria bacterium]|nr:DNA-3-methyladenine glycosylase [Candidatus Veblenbacteria bacterium]